MGVELHDPRIPVLRTLRPPAVLIGFPAETDGLTCIDLDFTAAGLLREHPDLTGVVVHNEPVVEPLLAAFADLGRSVPDDLSVIVISPDELAERTTPALTSVAIPADEIGRQAVGLLMAKLDGQRVPEATLLQPRLTRRASTGAPK